ncbi:MAG: glycosyltransferase [Bacteroidaceae bacterium]|nr:glycosyltransferase [Bacteroidaceae bacterium]
MISVCIATYNGSGYIERQLRSIVSQLSDTDEIIISDDGSSDDTIQVIEAMAIPQVKIVYNDKEHGYTPNFENALRYAKGDIIILSDQDDEWKEGRISVFKEVLSHHHLVASDAEVVDENKVTIYPSYFSRRRHYYGWFGNMVSFGYLGCTLAFRREILKKALPFPQNHKMCTHDNWLFMVASTFYSTAVIEDNLLYYFRRGDNTSAGGLRPTTTLRFKVQYRLYLLYNLAKRIWWR